MKTIRFKVDGQDRYFTPASSARRRDESEEVFFNRCGPESRSGRRSIRHSRRCPLCRFYADTAKFPTGNRFGLEKSPFALFSEQLTDQFLFCDESLFIGRGFFYGSEKHDGIITFKRITERDERP